MRDDACYYYNIIMVCVSGIMPEKIYELWYLDHIYDAIPYVVHFYESDEDRIDIYAKTIVEVTENGEVSFYI